MKVGVLGATGTAGKLAVAELAGRGLEVVSLGRRPAGAAAEHRTVDVVTGEGLGEAFAGIDSLVECLNAVGSAKTSRIVLVEGVGRALSAAAEAGVGHAVSLSIVGCDLVAVPYYKVKVEQESAVRAAGLETNILRATQFHQLLEMGFAATKRMGVLPFVAGSLQPIDPADVASALADLIERGPGPDAEIGGPEVLEIRELARTWRSARGSRRPLLRIPTLGGALKAIANGGLTAPGAPRGRRTWTEHLAGPA
jgi:uncharacterized protein YbjT (DUF2867 family)